MNDKPASPFWNFSLRIYGKPGVPRSCLALQSEAGLDVNVLLFCLFAAYSGRALQADDAAGILADTAPWKNGAVVNLRRARIYLREPSPLVDAEGAAVLRDRIKALELESERLQQEGLFASFPLDRLGSPALSPGATARHNAAALEKAMGATFDQTALDVILAAFDTLGDRTT